MTVLLLSLFVVCVLAKKLPPEITKCSVSDPKLPECITNAVKVLRTGSKELGVIPLEPIFIPKIDLGNSTSGAVSIHQEYENIKLHGSTSTVMKNLQFKLDDDDCYFRFNAYGPLIIMESDYKMSGKVLLFPINGHGKCNNSMYDFEVTYSGKCEKYYKRNQKYIRVTDLMFRLKPKRVVFDFENIVDGNEQLSKEVLKTMNENALAVYADGAPGFDTALQQIVKGLMNQVFSRVPEEDLYLP